MPLENATVPAPPIVLLFVPPLAIGKIPFTSAVVKSTALVNEPLPTKRLACTTPVPFGANITVPSTVILPAPLYVNVRLFMPTDVFLIKVPPI